MTESLSEIAASVREAKKHWVELKDRRNAVWQEMVLNMIEGSGGWTIQRYMPIPRAVVLAKEFWNVPDGLRCFNSEISDVRIIVTVKLDVGRVDIRLEGPVPSLFDFCKAHKLSVDPSVIGDAGLDINLLGTLTVTESGW